MNINKYVLVSSLIFSSQVFAQNYSYKNEIIEEKNISDEDEIESLFKKTTDGELITNDSNIFNVDGISQTKPKYGEVVNELVITQGQGQHEGVLGYKPIAEIEVRKVDMGSPLTANSLRTMEITTLAPLNEILVPENESVSDGEDLVIVNEEKKIDNQELNDSLSEGEELVDDNPVIIESVVVKKEKEVSFEEMEEKLVENHKILQNFVKNENLIGKRLVEENDVGDIDILQLLEELPPELSKFNIRVINHNMPVTMDFRNDRISISLDANKRIKNISIN